MAVRVHASRCDRVVLATGVGWGAGAGRSPGYVVEAYARVGRAKERATVVGHPVLIVVIRTADIDNVRFPGRGIDRVVVPALGRAIVGGLVRGRARILRGRQVGEACVGGGQGIVGAVDVRGIRGARQIVSDTDIHTRQSTGERGDRERSSIRAAR